MMFDYFVDCLKKKKKDVFLVRAGHTKFVVEIGINILLIWKAMIFF